MFFFFFKQKTAYEMRISDWSSDVCSSDLDYIRYAGEKAASVRRLHRTSLSAETIDGPSRAKPLHHILAGILTLSAGWKPPLGDTLAGHLRRDLDEASLDIGCIADAGWLTKCADSFELNTVDKAATRFLFALIAQLQDLGTAPMLHIGVSARHRKRAV